MAVSNFEIFEAFCEDVRNTKDNLEIIKMYGGGNIYVPSFKGELRDNEIYERVNNGESPKILHREYSLSVAQIYTIVKRVKNKIKNNDENLQQK